MDRSAWKRLGIAPTEDSRAIRKAYAARLKGIDPEQDPQAFIALREARDAALGLIDLPLPAPAVQRAPEEAPQLRPEPKAAAAAETREPPPPRPRKSPWQLPTLEEHQARLSALLFAPGRDSVDADALAAEAAALLRHPDLTLIGRAEQVEAWLAHAIVDAIPRSDALLAPAIAHFGWGEKAKAWNCPWPIEAAVARAADCRFRDAAWSGDHGPAMRVLAKPPPARTNALIAWAVGELLTEIRDNHPSLERDFDPDTIAWWDAELEARRRRFPWNLLRRLAV